MTAILSPCGQYRYTLEREVDRGAVVAIRASHAPVRAAGDRFHDRIAHYATFPRALVRPCVLAGCPTGGVVLDPFSGAATTGVVALELERSYIGIELSQEYQAMAALRLEHALVPRSARPQRRPKPMAGQLRLLGADA
jgi:hypothetical protein